MTRLDDERISKFHRQIYDWLKELYPSFKIEVEKVIPVTNQRIDIYIHQLNLAIECDGGFHDKPSFFFVKTVEQWNDIRNRDKLKNKTLADHGIDLIRIPYKHKLKSSSDLGALIEEFYRTKPDEKVEDKSIELFKDKEKEIKRERYLQARDKRKQWLLSQSQDGSKNA